MQSRQQIPELNGKTAKIRVEDAISEGTLPPSVTSVPHLIIQNGTDITDYVGNELFKWVEMMGNIMGGSSTQDYAPTKGEAPAPMGQGAMGQGIEDYDPASMSSNYSDQFSMITQDEYGKIDSDCGMSHRYTFLQDSLNTKNNLNSEVGNSTSLSKNNNLSDFDQKMEELKRNRGI